jgi:hypothetical protein
VLESILFHISLEFENINATGGPILRLKVSAVSIEQVNKGTKQNEPLVLFLAEFFFGPNYSLA